MITLELRPSTRLVQLIAAIERFSGRWERLAEITTIATRESFEVAAAEQTRAAFLLDSSTPSTLVHPLLSNGSHRPIHSASSEVALPDHPLVAAYLQAHTNFAQFDVRSIEGLYLEVSGLGGHISDPPLDQLYRTGAANFTLPAAVADGEDTVFQTVPPFLIRQRFEDLVEWLNRELEAGDYHPLFLFGTFHLLFLQTMPFARGNHRLGLLILWRLLNGYNYSFVQHTSFASVLAERTRGYLQSLRQAERTVFTTWNTLNIWLEFFLETVLSSTNNLSLLVEKGVEEQRLTRTQKNIIEIVRSRGPVTREIIVSESGINLSTVKYNLSVLAARGYLKRSGGGRTTSYWVS